MTLKKKLILSFLAVVLTSGAIATVVAVRVIRVGIRHQAQEKVRLDLNTAREIYTHELSALEDVVSFTALRTSLREALQRRDRSLLGDVLGPVRRKAGLDVLTVTDASGRVVFRAANPEEHGGTLGAYQVVRAALAGTDALGSTELLPEGELRREGQELAARARTRVVSTPRALSRSSAEERTGMMMAAAAPIVDKNGKVVGVLCGGRLLNRNFDLVDHIRDVVYQGSRYEDRPEGTATIFQGNLRIATNVTDQNGQRALGTQVSAAVQQQVLGRGLPWVDRAFVVKDWYITAYEPIRDLSGRVIGMLYVGMLERRFVDLERHAVLVFFGITLGGCLLSLGLAYLLATDLVRPVRRLLDASRELSRGNFSHRIKTRGTGELGELETMFNFMASSLEEREEALREETRLKLIRSERLASVGRLAAGVAHQINNPLTGVLTFGSLLLEEKREDDREREDLQTIVDETKRCREIVKRLLEFAKQAEPSKETVDLDALVGKCLAIVRGQALVRGVRVTEESDGPLPSLVADPAQLEQVFLNVMLNAIDAMPGGGELAVSRGLTADGRSVQVAFRDTGFGIRPEHLEKVFDPFFTTKGANGTGLGLAVAYGIVENHRGSIRMDSEVGVGTTCTVCLPLPTEE